MKMKSLAPMDVWPQSLTNGFLALRKSGTYWIRHTPVLSFFFCSHRAGLVVSKKKKTYPSTLQYRLVYQKGNFRRCLGLFWLGRMDLCRCQQPMDFRPCLGPMNFRLCLEPIDIPVRRYWIFAFGWKEWICVIGFASKPGPIDFRICPGSMNFYHSNWESVHTILLVRSTIATCTASHACVS